MENKNTFKNYEEVIQGVATWCSERPKERETGDLEKELAKAQLEETRKPCII